MRASARRRDHGLPSTVSPSVLRATRPREARADGARFAAGRLMVQGRRREHGPTSHLLPMRFLVLGAAADRAPMRRAENHDDARSSPSFGLAGEIHPPPASAAPACRTPTDSRFVGEPTGSAETHGASARTAPAPPRRPEAPATGLRCSSSPSPCTLGPRLHERSLRRRWRTLARRPTDPLGGD